jgi:hypothetical protein
MPDRKAASRKLIPRDNNSNNFFTCRSVTTVTLLVNEGYDYRESVLLIVVADRMVRAGASHLP